MNRQDAKSPRKLGTQRLRAYCSASGLDHNNSGLGVLGALAVFHFFRFEKN
jgi:hypothetical protein